MADLLPQSALPTSTQWSPSLTPNLQTTLSPDPDTTATGMLNGVTPATPKGEAVMPGG